MIWLIAGAALAQTPDEQAALDAYRGNRLLTARRLAEQVLEQQPESIYGHYVLGCAHREAEGNLSRAMAHLGTARRLYEEKEGVPGAQWTFHRELLDTVQLLAGELEEYDYQLTILDYYDTLYEPDLQGQRAWPLMKLGRYQEARSFAQLATHSPDWWQNSLGHNALCAIEAEAGDRAASYQACLRALVHERSAEQPDLTVDAFNAALAALGMARFDEAQQLAEEGINGQGLTTANPWSILVDLHLAAGRGQDAAESMRDLQRWKKRLPPSLRDQNRAEQDAALARLLLVAGDPEAGLAIIDRALLFPDRRALTTASSEQALGAHALIRLALRDLSIERTHEQVSAWGLPTRAGHWLGGFVPRPAAWEDQATLTAVLTNRKRLSRTFRPYMDGGLDGVPPWLVGTLIPLLGTGVSSRLVTDLRTTDQPAGLFDAYYDAYEAEIAWWSGRYAQTLTLGASALATLPRQEALLRGRTAARMADAARRTSDWETALGYYTLALKTDPGVLRRLRLQLPATVTTASSDPVAQHVSTLLARSPRIRWTRGTFTLSVEGTADDLVVRLRDASGNLISQVRAPKPAPEPPAEGDPPTEPWSDADYARHVVERFHVEAFSLPLGLTAHDLRSLDGSPVIASGLARERLEGLLDEVGTE